MSDEISMDEMLAQSVEARPGEVVEGTVVSQSGTYLLVDVGLKQEASLSLSEFAQHPPKTGDQIPVLIVRLRGPEGRPLVSWKQARERTHWDRIVQSFQNKEPVDGTITKRIKGGVQVDIGLDAFMPASQMDVRPVNKPEEWVGQSVQVLILEMDKSKGNVLVSRRKILDDQKAVKRAATLGELKVDQTIKGRITNVTPFGAFVDIGGIEGLLHVSDMAWTKVDNPKKIVKVGEEIEIKVLKFDEKTQKISLGRKQLLPHPWDGIEQKYSVGSTVKGKIISFASFGAFVEIEPGVDGLIHITEMSWTERLKSPKDKVKMGQEIEAKIIDIDRAKEKMALSLKRLDVNPWEEAAKNFPTGSQIEGQVTHLAPFGAFVKISLGIEALLKTQDLSWTERIQNPGQLLKVGDSIKAMVLEVDTQKEKMSLGLKQLAPDPLKALKVGQEVTGKISSIMDFGIFVKLDSGLDGLIRNSELQLDKSIFSDNNKDNTATKTAVSEQFKEGEPITASVLKINKKDRKLDLSIRKYERDQEKKLLRKYSGEGGRPTLGEATGWVDQS